MNEIEKLFNNYKKEVIDRHITDDEVKKKLHASFYAGAAATTYLIFNQHKESPVGLEDFIIEITDELMAITEESLE